MINKKSVFFLFGNGAAPSSALYFYHDAFSITRRNTGMINSEIGTQVFPISNYESATHNYIVVAAESKYFAEPDTLTSVDKTYVMKKSKTDGLHPNKGWAWLGDTGDGEPSKLLGKGGTHNEKKTPIAAKSVSTANLTLSGEQTINSISCVTGDVVIVRHQTDAKENGWWVVAVGAWSRHPDADTGAKLHQLSGRVDTPTISVSVRTPYFQTTENPTIGVDNIVIAPYTWCSVQNFFGNVLPKDGGGYLACYGANGPIVQSSYSVGVLESSDLENWTRHSHLPMFTGTEGGLHPRWVRIGNTLHIFFHSFAQPGTEGRIYRIRHHTTAWDDDPNNWSWTKISDDLFNGKGIITAEGSSQILGNMGVPWFEDGVWNFLSSDGPLNGYPMNQGRIVDAHTQKYVKRFTTTDFATFTEAETIYTHSQLGALGLNALCGKLTHGGYDVYPIIDYKWQSKATLAGVSEMWTNGKILTNAPPEDGELVHSDTGEVWPIALIGGGLLRTDQPQLGVLTPIDVLPRTPLDIVGSPARSWCASIQPASNAYIKRSGNIITYTNKFAFKCRHSTTFDTGAAFTIAWFGRASDGEEIFRLEHSAIRYRLTVRNGAGLYKQYRVGTLISSLESNPVLSADLLTYLGFIWNNGTLTMLAQIKDYTSAIDLITKDDSFTDLGSIGDELRIGVGSDPSTDFSRYPCQSVAWLNGDKATFENWVNLDVI